MEGMVEGKIVQVIGSTLDAEYPKGQLPNIYDALVTDIGTNGETQRLTCEVQQHLGGNRVRAVALGSTDGLVRGQSIFNTGAPVSVPVGEPTLGPRVQPARRAHRQEGRRAGQGAASPSTPRRPRSRTWSPRRRSSRPESRSWTSSPRT